jgi:trehalose/maltose transport system substrate-binding protein
MTVSKALSNSVKEFVAPESLPIQGQQPAQLPVPVDGTARESLSMFRSFILAATATIAFTASAFAAEVSITCGSVGAEQDLCKKMVADWEKKSGHTAKIISAPQSTTEQLALYQQILASGSSDIDVFQIDVIWPGILGQHLLDLAPYSKGAEKSHFEPIVANNTVGGQFVAMPWFTDAGLLYYRKDLLEKHGEKVPTTWDELAASAKKIQDAERAANDKFQGFVFQAKAYEGLTCDALEWVDSFGGGTIVDGEGNITINNAKAAAALDAAASWVGTIAPEGVLNYAEEEARGVWQSGNAAFMRNWPYAYGLGNADDSAIKGKFGVTALPKGGADGKNTGTLGGWQLAVSKYSKNPEVAADLVMFLTSEAAQKQRALEGSYLPTIPALYKDADILAKNPFMGELLGTFTNAVARPSRATGAQYNKVSTEFWNAAHSVLSKQKTGAQAVADLEASLARVKKDGWNK